jgi:subtilisin family serine protease
MRLQIMKPLGLFAVTMLLAISCQKDFLESTITTDLGVVTYEHQYIDDQYIVVFSEENIARSNDGMTYRARQLDAHSKAESFLNEYDLGSKEILQVYGSVLQGFAVKMSAEDAERIERDERVLRVERDQYLALGPGNGNGPGNGGPGNGNGGGGGGSTPPPQQTPWGITAVGGAGNGVGKVAWIIDSGIDLDHPDLNVDVANSESFLSGGGPNQSPEDKNGHGTHVAGTVAAINNTIGVVGVAAGATVVAVRVLDKNGSGTVSGVVGGVNYVSANASSGDVANMSLGGGASTTLDNAVTSAASNGIKFVLAAGNDGVSATNTSPARVNGTNIYTISAMDSNNNFASFSNYGNPPVDYCAPGVGVLSCYKSGGYATANGTSMAAPHVAGILLMGSVNSNSTVNNDPDGTADDIAIR